MSEIWITLQLGFALDSGAVEKSLRDKTGGKEDSTKDEQAFPEDTSFEVGMNGEDIRDLNGEEKQGRTPEL